MFSSTISNNTLSYDNLIKNKINKLLNSDKFLNLDDNESFIKLCKINKTKVYILKYFLEKKDLKIESKKEAYKYIFNFFIDSIPDNIQINIDKLKLFLKYLDNNNINSLKNEINRKIDNNINNKIIYSLLKSFYIDLNRSSLLFNNKEKHTNYKKKIDSILKAIIKTDNSKRVLFYINKILTYLNKKNLDIDYNEIIKVFNNLIIDDNILKNNNSDLILNIINICKKKVNYINDNEMENILKKIDNNLYDKIYFLNNNDKLILNKDESLSFLSKFSYEKKNFKEIDNLNLKRGFITGITKNNKEYLLKYQPNKSVLEIIVNSFLKKNKSNYFLIPEIFFMNSDNSYFYIIEKYNTDLYKYFNILEDNNKILSFKDLLNITNFLINGILELHKNNIIHCDLKLENIIINYDSNYNITDLKIIDFDVAVFNKIPEYILPLSEKYDKILNNKKPRGTRIYMIKNKNIDFKNDLFSLGVILIVLLYKNIKLMIILKKKELSKDDIHKYKSMNIKYQSILKKITVLKDKIEENDIKNKILNFIEEHLIKNRKQTMTFFSNDEEFNKFKYLKDLILDCISCRYNINELKEKYMNYKII
jgi:serine/threonine protein kinase